MGKQNVKDGTPVGNEHLCRRCSNGQFTVGYRETDVLVVCTNSNPARMVPFPVRECTDFWDRNRPGYVEMTKLALDFSACRRKPVAGFRADFVELPSNDENNDEDTQDEAARSVAPRTD
jgi:hypothetical protein